MFCVRLTAIVLPARSAGLLMPDDGIATTPKVSAVQSTAGARISTGNVPFAWASKKDT